MNAILVRRGSRLCIWKVKRPIAKIWLARQATLDITVRKGRHHTETLLDWLDKEDLLDCLGRVHSTLKPGIRRVVNLNVRVELSDSSGYCYGQWAIKQQNQKVCKQSAMAVEYQDTEACLLWMPHLISGACSYKRTYCFHCVMGELGQ